MCNGPANRQCCIRGGGTGGKFAYNLYHFKLVILYVQTFFTQKVMFMNGFQKQVFSNDWDISEMHRVRTIGLHSVTKNPHKSMKRYLHHSSGVTLAQLVKASIGQADVERFEAHLGHNWLSCGVFLVKSRHFGLPLAQTIRPNWQSLLVGA